MQNRAEYYMRMALGQALKARGKVSPNPLVGAVLVKANKVISCGFHRKAGLAHAEINAIKNAQRDLKGSTLYVTLEPCSHYGRTPPCVEAIIRSGIKEVVVGMKDPNPLNNGDGLKHLRRAGIRVKAGVLGDEARQINRAFIKFITKKTPYITVKAGMSLDARIATARGESKWITSKQARKFARGLRRDFDAVMVGINTLIEDNPSLGTSRQRGDFRKIIIDRQLKTPSSAKVFRNKSKVILVTSIKNPASKMNRFKGRAVILPVRERAGRLDLKQTMKRLARLDIANIFVEGGAELIGSLFDARLVDRVMFFIAPKIIGGRDALSVVMGEGALSIKKAHKLANMSVERIGEDLLVQADVRYCTS